MANLLFNISYGLYFLSVADGERKNACVINTLTQQTSKPELLSVTVNKANLTHDMIAKSGKCAVAILSEEAKFDLFRHFGMQSGKTVDKFASFSNVIKTERGYLIPAEGAVGYFETEVADSYDLGTHTLFTLKPVNSVVLTEVAPVTYSYYQSNIKPKPAAPKAETAGERWVCSVCGYVHEGLLPEDFVCPLCKHTAADFQRVDGNNDEKQNNQNKQNERRVEMKKWRCTVCGEIVESETRPDQCPRCKVPGEKFVEVKDEELNWAAEHVVGVAKGVDPEIVAGLRANFEGECSEVGMYLAMARVAHREGYPEIGLYWEKAAYEEAEHAAKFAELLGECLTDSTKKNLEMRVAAENGATKGKTDLAKRAKELGLDAIHDTVHEMARDEARHGKALKGLLDRYFK